MRALAAACAGACGRADRRRRAADGAGRRLATKTGACSSSRGATCPAWLAQVDRVPPADLLDRLIAETAYAYELRGPRRLQAWENLKKMRGLIRRIQNRGYATLAAHRRSPRLAHGRRRIERRARSARRGQPDDRARLEGPRVPDRLRRQPGERRERATATGAGHRRRTRRTRRYRSGRSYPRWMRRTASARSMKRVGCCTSR